MADAIHSAALRLLCRRPTRMSFMRPVYSTAFPSHLAVLDRRSEPATRCASRAVQL